MDSKYICNFMECADLRVFTGTADNIIDGCLLETGEKGQFVDCDVAVLAQLPDAQCIKFRVCHVITCKKTFVKLGSS